MSSFAAVLDTSVLFPASLRDTLLRSASAGLYRPRWSNDILGELRRSLAEHRRLTDAQTGRLLATIQDYFLDSLVEGYEDLVPYMGIDPKDRHVLAAAIAAHAEVIVTSNLRHFPEDALTPFNIRVRSPDEFLTGLVDRAPGVMARVLVEQAALLRRPPRTTREVISELAGVAPTFTAAILRQLEQP